MQLPKVGREELSVVSLLEVTSVLLVMDIVGLTQREIVLEYSGSVIVAVTWVFEAKLNALPNLPEVVQVPLEIEPFKDEPPLPELLAVVPYPSSNFQ